MERLNMLRGRIERTESEYHLDISSIHLLVMINETNIMNKSLLKYNNQLLPH